MNTHNPDILTCLANLSADEVFTPPKLAAAILDILPQDLFRRPDTTFLDPVCKSGVFLREIARRLNDGLKDQMPDEQARINHILTKQVFGLAITELTGQLSRRSVYCSKKADGKYSIHVESDNPSSLSLPDSKRFYSLVSSRKPFGLVTTFRGKSTRGDGDLLVYRNGGTGYTPRSSIRLGVDLIDKWKIFVGRAGPGTGNKDSYPHKIISTPSPMSMTMSKG